MKSKDRVGETRVAKNGIKMTIIAYRSSKDIDIEFEDGFVVTNKDYNNFKKGYIKHPKEYEFKYIGKKVKTKDGLVAEIVAYRSNTDIDILLEDGTLYTNCKVGCFKEGCDYKGYNSYIGKTKVMNCGQVAEIIAIRTLKDLDVKIGDSIIYNTNIYAFRNGELNTLGLGQNKSISRINEERLMNCGMKAKIIGYKDSKHITIKFEDGTVVSDRDYYYFDRGKIQNPNLPKKVVNKKSIKSHVGESRIMNCGLKATIVYYNSVKNITVNFDDGTIVKEKTYYEFLNGSIFNPNLKIGSIFSNFNLQKIGYKLENPRSVHYICRCTKCSYKDILTPTEMLEHKCSK